MPSVLDFRDKYYVVPNCLMWLISLSHDPLMIVQNQKIFRESGGPYVTHIIMWIAFCVCVGGVQNDDVWQTDYWLTFWRQSYNGGW